MAVPKLLYGWQNITSLKQHEKTENYFMTLSVANIMWRQQWMNMKHWR